MKDCNRLFQEGCSEIDPNKSIIKIIERMVKAEEWVNDDSNTYKSIPSWAKEAQDLDNPNNGAMREDQRELINNHKSDRYKQLIQRFINDQECLGNIAMLGFFEVGYVHLWNGAEENGWHWDGSEKEDFFIMMYFNDGEWDESWGGNFEVGERDLNDYGWLTETKNINVLRTYTAENGRVLLCSNQNPRLVHQPTPLMDKSKNRYTITAGINLRKR